MKIASPSWRSLPFAATRGYLRKGKSLSFVGQGSRLPGVDVLLAGHLHTSRMAGTGDRYALSGYEALVVSAGTATSTRARGEASGSSGSPRTVGSCRYGEKSSSESSKDGR
ncbi:MAG: hypothetical protein JF606_24785 [Burkholderiales bacterium]|nr:hypothetical protein [Burkholderiales bacterium]